MGKSKFILLLLLYVASFETVNADKSHKRQIEEGTDLTINCNVTLTPDLKIFWKKNGTESFHKGGLKLTLPSTTTKDSGDYICYRYNSTYEAEANATLVEHYTVDVISKSDSGGGPKVYIIIAAVVGGLLVVVAIIGAISRTRNKKSVSTDEATTNTTAAYKFSVAW